MDHRYEGKATFAGALHKMNKELTKAAKTLTSEETINGFTDKAQGAFAFDTVKKTVVKATSHEHGPPKEKHVQTLLSMAREKQNMQAVFQELFVRLRGKDATVALKTIMVFHRLLKEAPTSAGLYKMMLSNIHEFRLPNFLDDSTHESISASQMVRNYALYMEEKLMCVKQCGFEYDKDSNASVSHIEKASPELLMKDAKALMALMEAGYKCSCERQHAVHTTSIAAFSLIFKDMRILYQCQNKSLLRLLENYFESPKFIAQKILGMYKEFLKHNSKMSKLLEAAKELLGAESVDLQTPPPAFLESLEAYLLEDEAQPQKPKQEEAPAAPVIQLTELIGPVGNLSVSEKAPEKPKDPFDDLFGGDMPPAPPAAAAASSARSAPPAPVAAAGADLLGDVFGSAPPAASMPAQSGGGDLMGGLGGGGLASMTPHQQSGGNMIDRKSVV